MAIRPNCWFLPVEIFLQAREAGALRASQKHIARRCEHLMRGFARVGLDALIDEATGYQAVRPCGEPFCLAAADRKGCQRIDTLRPYEVLLLKLKTLPGVAPPSNMSLVRADR